MNYLSTSDYNYYKFPSLDTKEETKNLFDSSQKENLVLLKQESNPYPAAYKKKKSLKLLTNNNNEDPEKFKLFTPQPSQNPDSNILFLNSINCMSHPPTHKLKAQNSREFHDFFYQDEVHEVVMKRCGRKSQEDRVDNMKKKRGIFNFSLVLCQSHK